MDNFQYWNRMKRPPSTALKPISGGRMNGKTDINPQWRYQAMTEVFGPVGFGWTYSIDRQWTEPGAQGETMAFCNVSVRVKYDGEWSQPVPGTGGSTLIQSEKAGLRSNDEAFKMALTDALSVALKFFGVAADIYAGFWDGTKYRGDEAPPQQKPAAQNPQPAQPSAQPQPAPVKSALQFPATLAEAEAVTDGGGNPYKSLTTEKLQSIRDSQEAPELKRRAAKMILEARASK